MSGTSSEHNAQPTHAPRTGWRAEGSGPKLKAPVSVVGGYGFLIWMVQMVLGPPGPPGA